MAKNDGGPAYPFKEEDGQGGFQQFPGMSLREYFAAAAMNGYLSAQGPDMDHGRRNPSHVAQWAYQTADAMIAAQSDEAGGKR